MTVTRNGVSSESTLSPGGALTDLASETIGTLPSGAIGAHASAHITGGSDAIQLATASVPGLATAAQITKLDGIEALAEVTSTAKVDAAGAFMNSDVSSNGYVRRTGAGAYTTDTTATPATHASAHVTGGSDKIRDASSSQDGLMTTAYATKLDGIEALADVTDAANVTTAGAVMDGDFSTNGFMTRTGAGAYGTQVGAAPTTGIGAANSAGSASTPALSDHNHKLRTGSTDITIGTLTTGEYLKLVGTEIQSAAAGGASTYVSAGAGNQTIATSTDVFVKTAVTSGGDTLTITMGRTTPLRIVFDCALTSANFITLTPASGTINCRNTACTSLACWVPGSITVDPSGSNLVVSASFLRGQWFFIGDTSGGAARGLTNYFSMRECNTAGTMSDDVSRVELAHTGTLTRKPGPGAGSSYLAYQSATSNYSYNQEGPWMIYGQLDRSIVSYYEPITLNGTVRHIHGVSHSSDLAQLTWIVDLNSSSKIRVYHYNAARTDASLATSVTALSTGVTYCILGGYDTADSKSWASVSNETVVKGAANSGGACGATSNGALKFTCGVIGQGTPNAGAHWQGPWGIYDIVLSAAQRTALNSGPYVLVPM